LIARARQLALAGLLLLASLCAPAPSAAREYLQLFVTEPYLELHTGPGRGYPVFNVVPRDASVDVLFRRTDWFKVRTERGVEGWASQADMLKTVLADGTPFRFPLGDRAGFTAHRWEMGIFGAVGNYLGKFTNGVTGDIGLAHIILPEARLSPFLMLGVGLVRVQPKATLVQPVDRTEQTAYVGGGLRYYLTRRFFLRAEYKAHWIFTKRNENEESDEWKLGFAFFY